MFEWLNLCSVTPGHMRESLGATRVNPEMAAWQGVIVEAWLTCLLMLTVRGATCEKRRKVYMPSIPIGLVIGMDVMVGVSARFWI